MALKGVLLLPNEELKTLHLKNNKNDLMFYMSYTGGGYGNSMANGLDFSRSHSISIDDIKLQGIEVIYK